MKCTLELEPIHWIVQVKILDVHCHVLGTFGGQYAVPVAFDGYQVSRLCGNVIGMLNQITSHRCSDSMLLFLVLTDVTLSE